jgi:hypothetical protein
MDIKGTLHIPFQFSELVALDIHKENQIAAVGKIIQ